MSARILLIEDDADLAFGLRNNLEIEGYEVRVATDGQAGLDALLTQPFDLAVLDLMLPGIDGLRVLSTIRDRDVRVPVVILTARGQESDKVRGLRLGADDYLTKPFGVLELLARIEAVLRRVGPSKSLAASVRFGDVVVDPAGRVVHRADHPVELSPKEFDLLWALISANGAAVSRNELMQQVWGYEATVLSRTVDTHMAELRRKLEPYPAEPRHLITVRKVGYRFQR
jgi:two-component system alkaline phosphatase synthesis response regulator PhoP